MVTCEATKSYKIPLKSCHNSIIEHHHVTICFNVEWPDRGDDPKLVIDITDKKPPISYAPPNHLTAPPLVNSVHHYHQQQQQQQQQQQENLHSMYRQQQYYHHHHHLSTVPNNHDLSRSTTTTITAGDHNDGSSITATVHYDVIQPQGQSQILTSSAAIQQIKNHLTSQLSPALRNPPTGNPQYLFPQHVIQTPGNMNETRLNTHMSTINHTAPVNTISSVTTDIQDLQQAPPMTYPTCSSPSLRQTPIICSCTDPNHHRHGCPVIALNRQQSDPNPNPETIYLPTNARRTSFPSRTNPNDMVSNSATTQPILTAALLPTCNSMYINTSNPSTNVTTIVSQHSPYVTNNKPIDPILKPSVLNIDNNFQRGSLILPQVLMGNQPNYQSNPSVPISRQLNNTPIPSRLHKSRLLRQESLSNSDQTLFQTRNDVQSQNRLINQSNSPSRQQTINPSSLLSSSNHMEQRIPTLQDNSQTVTNLSLTNSLHGSVNDLTGRNTKQQQQQQLSLPDSTVRSPVTFDSSMLSVAADPSVSPEKIDQAIEAVVKGEGTIILDKKSVSVGSQQQQKNQQKQSSSPQLVWEQNGPVITKTYLSPLHQKQQLPVNDSNTSTLTHQNVVNITAQTAQPLFIEQNAMETLRRKQIIRDTRKRTRPKLTNNTNLKRNRKTPVNISQPKRTSSITSTSTLISKPLLSSSSASITTTGTFRNNLDDDDDAINGFEQTSTTNYINDLDRHSATDGTFEQIIPDSQKDYIFDLDDVFSSETVKCFNSSTPPPPPSSSSSTSSSSKTVSTSIPSQLLTPVSARKSSTTPVTSTDDFYEDFFSSQSFLSSSSYQANQTTSSVLTPPYFHNNSFPQQQQQHHSQTFECFATDQQSQTQASQTNFNAMNNSEQVPASSKQKPNVNQTKPVKHPVKPSRRQNRFNPNHKQTSVKSTCTSCGSSSLIDITHHEFPKQKGLVFECVSCGNNSIRSNVSANERQRRLNKIAVDYSNRVECQFCHKIFHSHGDYLMHLKNDHASNKPI